MRLKYKLDGWEKGGKMKKVFMVFMALLLLCAVTAPEAAALNFSATAGDQDYGALRDAFDDSTNMDYYVVAV